MDITQRLQDVVHRLKDIDGHIHYQMTGSERRMVKEYVVECQKIVTECIQAVQGLEDQLVDLADKYEAQIRDAIKNTHELNDT